jgi:hypothetical protein
MAFVSWVFHRPSPDAWLLMRLSLNSGLPSSVRRDAFARRPWNHLWNRVVEHAELAEFLTEEELTLLDRAEAEQDSRLTEEEVDRLASLGEIGLSLAVLQPKARFEHARRLLRTDTESLIQVLSHPRLSPAGFACAAEVPDWDTNLLRNPSLPASCAERILRRVTSTDVLIGLASHPKLSPALQLEMAGFSVFATIGPSRVPEIRHALRKNPSLTQEARVAIGVAEDAEAQDWMQTFIKNNS